MGKRLDIIGDKYVRLTVIEEIDAQVVQITGRATSMRHFLCRCDCGNEKQVSMSALRSGLTRSCGCLRREVSRENASVVKWTEEKVIETLRAAYIEMDLGGEPMSRIMFNTRRRVAMSMYAQLRLGWLDMCRLAGLPSPKKERHRQPKLTDEEMLKLLREQYESTGSKHLSKLIRPSSSLYAHRFGSWIRALELAGITTTRNKKSSP